jgi:hypothetical protein
VPFGEKMKPDAAARVQARRFAGPGARLVDPMRYVRGRVHEGTAWLAPRCGSSRDFRELRCSVLCALQPQVRSGVLVGPAPPATQVAGHARQRLKPRLHQDDALRGATRHRRSHEAGAQRVTVPGPNRAHGAGRAECYTSTFTIAINRANDRAAELRSAAASQWMRR